jgi:predicted RNA-binding protein
MAYWLYLTNFDNWKVTKATNILGASERHRGMLSRAQIGDKCLVYVMSENREGEIIPPKIVGEYSIASKLYEDETRIFKAPTYSPPQTFHLRLKLKPLNVFKDPIQFKPLVPRLSFITNKHRYSLHLKGKAIVKIPEGDYNLITRERL